MRFFFIRATALSGGTVFFYVYLWQKIDMNIQEVEQEKERQTILLEKIALIESGHGGVSKDGSIIDMQKETGIPFENISSACPPKRPSLRAYLEMVKILEEK
jgi:hypothetical protein